MPKGPFFSSSNDNGTDPNELLEALRAHYDKLSATYLQKGMKKEAELFRKGAEKFARLAQELKELSDKKA